MAEVLIVNPPSPDGHLYIRDTCRWGRKSRERMIWPQTTLAYLAAMVPAGQTVRIIDAIAEEMPIPQFCAEIAREKPRVYVSYITGTTFAVDALGIREAKRHGAITIAIGTHVSAVPGNTLNSLPELDYVMRHETELTFREVLERLASGRGMAGCLGLAHRDPNGQVVVSPDRPLLASLDELPIPRQELLPLDRYRMPFLGSRYTWVLTNRGCPYSCTYCFEGVVWGKSVRYRSARSIFQELEYLAAHDVHNVLFLADLFTFDRRGVLELCELIIASGLKIRWTCNSRVDTLDEEMLLKMKQAGCWLIAFGIESGSQAVLDNVKKSARVEDAVRAIGLCDRHGVKSWGYFMIGLPGETAATVRETIDLAKRLPLDLALFHVAMPYAGTEFYFQAVANGWLTTADWQHFDMNDSVVVGYQEFSAAEIFGATKQAFREFYLRPRQVWRLAKMLLGTGDLGLVWQVGKNFGRWLFSEREDRVAREPVPAGAVSVDDARSTVHSAPVIEAPRTDPATAKPQHAGVKEVTKTAG